MDHVILEKPIRTVGKNPPGSMRAPAKPPLNILVLYGGEYTYINTVYHYLDSFSQYSQNNVYYAAVNRFTLSCTDLSSFDVVVVHYSLRICFPKTELGPSFEDALTRYQGYKVLFIQDEYDNTEIARQNIARLGFNAVFTCVPEPYVAAVYPKSRFSNTRFISMLTGYVSADLQAPHVAKPMAEREIMIGYRGRQLAYKYGNLAQEKWCIGQQMREICQARGLPVDIEWTEDKRIYGDDWYGFLASCKATLGSESGANIFDDIGAIGEQLNTALAQDPDLSYEDAYQRFLAPHEGKVMMNQISPRIFEAIAFKTALILFEGEYSGIIQPEQHYMALKKDFSNVDEVLDKLQDNAYLEALTERAYQDIIVSGRYTYQRFIQQFDSILDEAVIDRQGVRFYTTLIGHQYPNSPDVILHNTTYLATIPTTAVLRTYIVSQLRRDASSILQDLRPGFEMAGRKICLKLRKKWQKRKDKLRAWKQTITRIFRFWRTDKTV